MDIRYEYVNITQNNYFEYLMSEKLGPIIRKYPFVDGAKVFFKVENNADHIDNICEIKIIANNENLTAANNQESIELAINKSAKDIETQLEHIKSQLKLN